MTSWPYTSSRKGAKAQRDSTDCNKVVVAEQNVDQVLAGMLMRVGRGGRHVRASGRGERGFRSRSVQVRVRSQELFAGGDLFGPRRSRQNRLERRVNERRHARRLVCRADFVRKVFHQQSRLVERQGTVAQGQRLLRHHAFLSAVALVRVRLVEQFQELHFLVWCAAEVQAATARRLSFRFRNLRAARCEVELIGCVQYAVANDFRFHASRVHAPDVPVVRVEEGRSAERGGRRARIGVTSGRSF